MVKSPSTPPSNGEFYNAIYILELHIFNAGRITIFLHTLSEWGDNKRPGIGEIHLVDIQRISSSASLNSFLFDIHMQRA